MYNDILPSTPGYGFVSLATAGKVNGFAHGERYEIVRVMMHSQNLDKKTVVVVVSYQCGIHDSTLPKFHLDTLTDMRRTTSLIRFHKEGINEIIRQFGFCPINVKRLRRAWGIALRSIKDGIPTNQENMS